MDSFIPLKESAAKAATAKLKNMKGKSVSFTSQASGKKVSGTYKGMKQMGGRSYAHIETGKGAHRVPPHHIHQTQTEERNSAMQQFKTFLRMREELAEAETGAKHLTMVVHDGEEHHVIRGVAHNDANADKLRRAVGKAAAKHAGVSHADMEDDYSNYNHHEKAHTPGAAGKTVTHKNAAAYVKHHAKNDADTYGDGMNESVNEGVEDDHADTHDDFETHISKVKSPTHKKAFTKEFHKHDKQFGKGYEGDDDDHMHAAHDAMKDVVSDIKKHNSSNE